VHYILFGFIKAGLKLIKVIVFILVLGTTLLFFASSGQLRPGKLTSGKRMCFHACRIGFQLLSLFTLNHACYD
jgi:hypothetical protein